MPIITINDRGIKTEHAVCDHAQCAARERMPDNDIRPLKRKGWKVSVGFLRSTVLCPRHAN